MTCPSFRHIRNIVRLIRKFPCIRTCLGAHGLAESIEEQGRLLRQAGEGTAARGLQKEKDNPIIQFFSALTRIE